MPTNPATDQNYYLHFPKLEKSPLYQIKETLTVGSEVGDALITGHDLSARHCSFFLNQDVVMIQDHRSQSGTFLNGQKLTAGKMYICELDDQIQIGSLKASLRASSEPHFDFVDEEVDEDATSENINSTLKDIDQHEFVESERTQQLKRSLIEEDESEVDDEDEHDSTTSVDFGTTLISSELREGFEKQIFDDLDDTTIAINRKDLTDDEQDSEQNDDGHVEEREMDEPKGLTSILKLGLEKRKNYNSEKKVLSAKTSREQKSFTNKYLQGESAEQAPFEGLEVSQRGEEVSHSHAIMRMLAWSIDILMATAIYLIFSPFVDFINLLNLIVEPLMQRVPMIPHEMISFYHVTILYLLLRMLSNLFFSVSFGQLLTSIRSSDTGLWSRIGGMLREFLGVCLSPLFDLPALIGKRTFKELITKTSLTTTKPFIGFLFGLVLLGLICVVTAVAPLFKGLEVYQTGVFINSAQEDKRKAPPLSDFHQDSRHFLLSYQSTDRLGYQLYPSFMVESEKGKKVLTPVVKIWSDPFQEVVEFKKVKTFKFEKLLGVVAKFNPKFYSQYPEFKKYLNNPKASIDTPAQLRLEQEFEAIVKTSTQLSTENVIDFVLSNGPVINSFVNFKQALDNLTGLDDVSVYEITALGSRRFLKLSPKATNLQESIDHYLIPLNFQQGIVYQVTIPRFVKYSELKRDFFQEFFRYTHWPLEKNFSPLAQRERSQFHIFDVIDYFMDSKLDPSSKAEAFQYIAFYFQRIGSQALEENNPKKLKLVRKIMANVINSATILSNNSPEDNMGLNPYDRLVQELNQILKALDENNRSFFGMPARGE